ncbi:MAG: HNH endonuclease [Myxococcales bacterium]|nr:HNH endonuclease [Myxococcales bacterium]
MQAVYKTNYDTLHSGPERDRAFYWQRHLRRKGLTAVPGGGRMSRFREIDRHRPIGITDVVRGELERHHVSEYHFYRWNVRPLCTYCGSHLGRSGVTRDHVIPASRGGKSNHDNLVPACAPCNRAKADHSLLHFLVERRRRVRASA